MQYTIVKVSGNREYKQVENGTCYHVETPDNLIEILETHRQARTRLRFFFGDMKTGRDWNAEWHITGTIGRSTGNIKIPLVMHSARSYCGGALADHCIVKLISGKRVLWQHATYFSEPFAIVDGDMTGYDATVLRGGEVFARFKTKQQAQRFIDFLEGRRNTR